MRLEPEHRARRDPNPAKPSLVPVIPARSTDAISARDLQAHSAIEAASNPGDAATAGGDGEFIDRDGLFGITPFAIPRGAAPVVRGSALGFELSAPSTRRNAARLLRAMQLPKPILLEGSPGVGKTSLVSALAKAAGHNLVRINLSEQTDMMDLLGADLPADGGAAGEFRWADGAFLAALKNGDWVLLDELNLAPQPVLEGLNAALDHRAEVFVPELGETFRCPPTFRVFAAQNPVQEGGGRKGLPKSFLNRFTRVHVEPMESSDLVHITRALYPRIPATVVERMVAFTAALSAAASVSGGTFARAGAPWEFNLRDLLRWCDLIEAAAATAAADDPDSVDSNGRTQTDVELAMDAAERAVDATFATLFVRRLRTAADRAECAELFASAFGRPPTPPTPPAVAIRDGALRVGHAVFPCGGASANVEHDTPLGLLRGQLGALEAAAHCAARGWMTIVVGPPASGKTSLVQTLASLAGRTLRQVALTAATDTSELLGSFEQKESARDRATIEAEALAALRASAADALAPATTAETARGDADDSNDDATRATESAWAAWSRYRAIIEASAESTSAEDAEAAKAALDAALVAIETLRVAAGARDDDTDEDAMDEGREGVEGSIASLRARAARLGPEAWGGAAPAAGRFEWVDGVLLKAAVRGEWVLLENANLCSPTVLDRLNPLLEIGGSLLVSECGMRDGEPRVITAHPNFRLFLALDPRRGEVSRAMRNRGVEVFLAPPETETEMPAGVGSVHPAVDITVDPAVDHAIHPAVDPAIPAPLGMPRPEHTATCDLNAVLAAAGVPAGATRDAMSAAHVALVTGAAAERDADVAANDVAARAAARAAAAAAAATYTPREAARWAALASELLARGVGASAALAAAWEHVYARGEASPAARRAARAAFSSACAPYLDALRRTCDAESPSDDADDAMLVDDARGVRSRDDERLVARDPFAAARRAMRRSVFLEPLGWPSSPGAARRLAEAAGCDASRARRAGALVEAIAAALAGRQLVAARDANDPCHRDVPASVAAALPLDAVRRRVALASGDEDRSGGSDGSDDVATDANATMSLARGLRAAGLSLVTGVAHGAPRGLAPSQLEDVAAWIRRLARRCRSENIGDDGEEMGDDGENIGDDGETIGDDGETIGDDVDRVAAAVAATRSLDSLDSLDSFSNALPASLELRAVADAADALAAHPSVTLSSAEAFAIRASVARASAFASRRSVSLAPTTLAAAVSSDCATAAQFAEWRRANPDQRGRGVKVHPYVDALANLLSAAEAMEDALFRALAVVDKAADGAETDGAKPHPETPSAKPRARKNGQKRASAAVAAASAAQDWRLRLEALAASTPARATRYDANGAPPDAAATQSLATTYALTRDAFSSAADAAAAARAGDARAPEDVDESRTPSRAWEVWRQASDAMDAALGVPSGKPAEPLLWRAAGHPTTPRTEPLRRAEEDVRAMCAALRPGTSAGAAAAAAAAKAIRDGRTDAANAIVSAKNAAAAAVGTPAGAALRAAALEGLCFFAWTRAAAAFSEDDARVENGNGNGNQLALGNGDGGAFSTGARAADADAAAFLEREAGSIPAQLAAECRVVAAAAKVSETKGETAKDVGADGSSAGADGSSAVAIAGSSASEPVPPEYSLPATNLLRSLDALERPGRSVPPLGFPAWSLRWPAAAAAHASLMPLLELHSVATQPALLAKLTRRVALRAAEEVAKDGPNERGEGDGGG